MARPRRGVRKPRCALRQRGSVRDRPGRISASVRVRPTVAAALVGGLGTSVAELIVAGVAAAKSPSLAIGSLVGSIVANVCLALAIAALITPLKVDSATVPEGGADQRGVRRVVRHPRHRGYHRWSRASSCCVALGAAVAALLFGQGRGSGDPLGSEMAEFASIETSTLACRIGSSDRHARLDARRRRGDRDLLARRRETSRVLRRVSRADPGRHRHLGTARRASIQAARAKVSTTSSSGTCSAATSSSPWVAGPSSDSSRRASRCTRRRRARAHGRGRGRVVARHGKGATLQRSETVALVLAYAACLPFVNR